MYVYPYALTCTCTYTYVYICWRKNWFLPIRINHWSRVTHICVGKLIIIGSDNGLSPARRQAIIWTNAAILLIRPLGTNLFIQENAFENIACEMASILSRPQCVNAQSIAAPNSNITWIAWLTKIYFDKLGNWMLVIGSNYSRYFYRQSSPCTVICAFVTREFNFWKRFNHILSWILFLPMYCIHLKLQDLL